MTYDKVSWHFPEGTGCPSLERAKEHIRTLMDGLSSQDLLSDFGKEVQEIPISSDTAVTSDMLTDEGDRILPTVHKEWVKTVDYSVSPDVSALIRLLREAANQS